jgi:hypothetical protein
MADYYYDYKHIGFTAIWPPSYTYTIVGFTGECHNCYGKEVILMSAESRSKDKSTRCGKSAETQSINSYSFTRSGPSCYGLTLNSKVYRPSEEHIRVFGIQQESIVASLDERHDRQSS